MRQIARSFRAGKTAAATTGESPSFFNQNLSGVCRILQ
jgi:hypothetical protein